MELCSIFTQIADRLLYTIKYRITLKRSSDIFLWELNSNIAIKIRLGEM